LGEAMREWERSSNFFYRLEREGRLLGIWVGQRVYFSRRQLVQLLGEPIERGKLFGRTTAELRIGSHPGRGLT